MTHDVPTWKFEKDGAYSVKSAYKDILNHDVSVVQHRVSGNWNCVWSLKLPPKVKNFLWRACRNCLPTRICLQVKGVQCTDRCARIGLWSPLMATFDTNASFPTNVFAILQHLDQHQKQVFDVTLWSIWKHRNNKVWNNVTETSQAICDRASSLLSSWRNAQIILHPIPQHSITLNDLKWVKPSPDRFKCNVDASFLKL
uniref:Thioredoxin-like fold n=1 Tax=Medicago truncatula TaxID=3880 RepID=A2Q5D8_MEDTR|nr:Thioredoxin-like fold [Medicago truncatula]